MEAAAFVASRFSKTLNASRRAGSQPLGVGIVLVDKVMAPPGS